MEIMVAMILSTIAFSLIYGTYTFYNKNIHSFSQRRNSYKAVTYCVDFIADELRKSEKLLSFSETTCSYLSVRGDTTTFSFSEDSLFRKRNNADSSLFYLVDSLSFTPSENLTTSQWQKINITGFVKRDEETFIPYTRHILVTFIDTVAEF